jgi:hypothetical protein
MGAICFEAESSFGENVSTFATGRLAHQGMVDTSGLEQAMIECGNVQQHLQGKDAPIVGVMGGGFKTKLYLCGHGSTTAGATSATNVPTLMGLALGSSGVSAASGTTATGGTASVPTTTASGTFTAGSLARFGTGIAGSTAADGRGSGQWAAIASHVTTTMTLLNALPGAPNNGDVIYSAEMVYLSELPTSTAITGMRGLLQTNNQQYEVHGCWAKSITFAIDLAGGLPTYEVDWGTSWFKPVSTTFPSAVTMQTFQPAPAGGNTSWFFQDYGTVTRNTVTARSWSLTVGLNNIPLVGPGGVNQYQVNVGAVRGPAKAQISFVVDAPTASTTPQNETDWAQVATAKHGLLGLSSGIGTSFAVYAPRMFPAGSKFIQRDDGGINRVRYTYDCTADSSRSTDQLASAVRFAFG